MSPARESLDVHVDFNFVEESKAASSHQSSLYLNPVWDERWVAHSTLDQEVKRCEAAFPLRSIDVLSLKRAH